MASFTFVHAADLHLGSPFKGLTVKDPSVAARFALATRAAFCDLVARTIEADAAFLILAGDLYDGEWPDNQIALFLARELARLDRAGIPTVWLRGNHDAASSVTNAVALPGSVHELPVDRPGTVPFEALGVAIHGQGFASRVERANLAAAYPPPVPGAFNVGVLHTSLNGDAENPYAPVSPAELSAKGYDYWALGHVHDFEVVTRDPPIVYPGNLQGRSVREVGPKGAVRVTVEDRQVVGLERMIVDAARWALVRVDVSAVATVADVVHLVNEAVAAHLAQLGDRLLALRAVLTGRGAFATALRAQRDLLSDEIEAAVQRLHPDVWLERVVIETAPDLTPYADVDLATVLAAAEGDQALQALARQTIEEVAAKVPEGAGDTLREEPLEEILADARALLAERVRG